MSGLALLVVAGGKGMRAGGPLPKQYAPLAGRPLLRRTLDALAAFGAFDHVCVAIAPEDLPAFTACTSDLTPRPLVAKGGAARQVSVLRGLEALEAAAPEIVLIHDAARPFVEPALVSRLVAAAAEGVAAIPGTPVADTLKRVREGAVEATIPRDGLFSVQTPQAFPFSAILEAHRQAARDGRDDLTDDSAVAEASGLKVRVVRGDAGNFKITHPEDWARAEAAIGMSMETRTGQGYDVHAFGDGDAVWLCGVKIPHDRALVGHSDADVALHALTDAILGAIGDGDIGQHFPPSDPQWRGASSDRFFVDALRRLGERGGAIVHLDLTIVCETPKIGHHRETMRQRVAALAGIDTHRVGVKATTSEGLGFTGRREGIAALALATVRLPGD